MMKVEKLKENIKEKIAIMAIAIFVILLFFLWLPFVPAFLAEYCPEPIKSVLEWIADYGGSISWFQP